MVFSQGFLTVATALLLKPLPPGQAEVNVNQLNTSSPDHSSNGKKLPGEKMVWIMQSCLIQVFALPTFLHLVYRAGGLDTN